MDKPNRYGYSLLEMIAEVMEKDIQDLLELAFSQDDFFKNWNRLVNFQLNLGAET